MNNREKQVLYFFGHHKCGTQWIQGILQEVCQDMGLNYGHAYNAEKFNHDLELFIANKKIDIFSYTNANYKEVRNLENFRGFHVVRDPRDIVVSAYYSHLYSHPTDQSSLLQKEREKLQKMSQDEGLLQEIEFNESVFNDMNTWNYEQQDVLEIKMEDLMTNPYATFVDIFRFLGIVSESRPTFKQRWNHLSALTYRQLQQSLFGKVLMEVHLERIPYERALGIIYENRFQKKTKGRKPGAENIKSHYRKGVAGDWKNHFKPEHTELFKQKYNDLLIKLNYEKDDNW